LEEKKIHSFKPGLPDGTFLNQKKLFGFILIENIGIFCGHLEYFTTILNVLWTFGIFCGHLVNFSPFYYVSPRKIWQNIALLTPAVTCRSHKPSLCLKAQGLANT
jgi:hypothetical protein